MTKVWTCSVGHLLLLMLWCQQILCQSSQEEDFAPAVTARCEGGNMTIAITTQRPFYGVIHTKDFRRPPCQTFGDGAYTSTLVISYLANTEDYNYCGVQKAKGSDEQSVTIAVRGHRTLELAEDKVYRITCGKSGFRNARNELSRVSLNFLEKDQRVTELLVGHQYTLRASVSKPEGITGLRVKSCSSFSQNTSSVELIDSQGCPKADFISKFKYNKSAQVADSVLLSTFRFPNSNKVHVQCDIVVCRGNCLEAQCRTGRNEQLPQALPQSPASPVDQSDDVQLMASTTVFVLEPGDSMLSVPSRECTEWRFPWLIGLCICLAILLLIMLIVNIFLCSSLTCTCTKTEVVEKEPSEMDDYDPYKVGWAPSSHYGSRTSLNKPVYMSGGSTLNSARSVSNGSDHYTIVHSRPNSRYSQHSGKEPLHPGHHHHHHRGPGSALSNGQYSSRI